jgi:hypothetical protein
MSLNNEIIQKMTLEQLRKIISTGREIELSYCGKDYSLTYYNDSRKDYISFCEFDMDVLDVSDADSLWNSTYHGIKVSDIFESLGENDYSLF